MLVVMAILSAFAGEAIAQSWDVTVTSATGKMQRLQGSTFSVRAFTLNPGSTNVRGIAYVSSPGTMVNIDMLLLPGVSSTANIYLHDSPGGFHLVSQANVQNVGAASSFSASSKTSDGGTVSISVTFRP
jgi:hypothetical protein